MKKLSLLILVVLAAASLSMAQSPGPGVTPGNGEIPYPTTNYNSPPVIQNGDVLGAHLGYGRGCVMCHAPHGGALGNGNSWGTSSPDTYNGATALWGQNLTLLYGQSVTFYTSSITNTTYSVTLPTGPLASSTLGSGATTIILCLSCHDGLAANVSMMHGTTVETLPIVGGNGVTKFASQQGNSSLVYTNEHPVGPNAVVSCDGAGWGSYQTGTGSANWDCTTGGGISGTKIVATGTAITAFRNNYAASFWNGTSNPLATFGASGQTGYTVNAVTCTTCHNQHNMTVWTVGGKNYETMFFLRGFYNPYTGGNSAAQFCRNCHGMWSNEYYGILNTPTT